MMNEVAYAHTNHGAWRCYAVLFEEQLKELSRKLERFEVFGLDTESDGPLLVDGWKKTKKRGRTVKYKNFINMFRSTTVGYSIAFPDRTAYYVPISHRKDNAPYGPALRVLRQAVETQGTGWVHNLSHELHAFERVGLVCQPESTGLRCSQVAAWTCSWGTVRGLGLKQLSPERVGLRIPEFKQVAKENHFGSLQSYAPEPVHYACSDAIAALLLGEQAKRQLLSWNLGDWYETVEHPFIWVCHEMHKEGLPLDREKLVQLRDEAVPIKESLAAQFGALCGYSITSPVQQQKLFEEGTWPDVGKYTKGEGYQTGAEALEIIKRRCKKGSKGRELADIKLSFLDINKIASTYSVSLIENADQYPDGRLHPSYNQTGTETGRLSSSYPNAQNIPVRSKLGKRVLECFVAPEGTIIGSVDFSQIELRILAHYVGGSLLDAYREGKDAHQATADSMGKSRDAGKTLNFCTVYGGGARKLQESLGLSKSQAYDMLKLFDANMPEVPAFKKRVINAAYTRGYVRTVSGRRRMFPKLAAVNSRIRRLGWRAVDQGIATKAELGAIWHEERAAFNTICQGGAGDLFKQALVRVYQNRPSDVRFHAQIHDDLRFTMPDRFGDTSEALNAVVETMQEAPTYPNPFKAPIRCDAVTGHTWKDLK